MNLKFLTDHQLHLDTKMLVRDERKVSIKILHHLKEIDRRRLYSDIGYGSLFDYVVKELGYSPGSAYRRIQAARLLVDVPEVENKILTGCLNLTQVCDATTFFRENEIREPNRKIEVLRQIENLSKTETSRHFALLSGKPEKRFTPVPLSFETLAKVNEWKSYCGQGSSDELVSSALDVAIGSRLKTKLNSKIKREVYSRDEGCCTICGATFKLEFDHRTPKSLGGSDEEQNLRLLCFSCNQRARIRAGL